MARAFEDDELPAGMLGKRCAAAEGAEAVLVAVDDEHGAANVLREPARLLG
jgi:hypothetical protein